MKNNNRETNKDRDQEKEFHKIYKYIVKITSSNKTLSNLLTGISLTSFVFLISFGYPEMLDEIIIIGQIQIFVLPFSLAFLALSFFMCLTSSLFFYFIEGKTNNNYYYNETEDFSKRIEKIEKYIGLIGFANIVLGFGVFALIYSVIVIFLYFSTGGIILSLFLLLLWGGFYALSYILHKSKKKLKLKKTNPS